MKDVMVDRRMRNEADFNVADTVRRLAPFCAKSVAQAALSNKVRASGDVVEGWAFCGLMMPEVEGRSLADLVALSGQAMPRAEHPELTEILAEFPEVAPSGASREDAMTIGLAARNVVAALVDDGEIEPDCQPNLVASCIAITVVAIAGDREAGTALEDVVAEIREQENDLAPTASEIMDLLEE